MIFNFQKELRKRGFRGHRLKLVKNGVLYEYVRKEIEKEISNSDKY